MERKGFHLPKNVNEGNGLMSFCFFHLCSHHLLHIATIMYATLSHCAVHCGYFLWFAQGMESHRPFFLKLYYYRSFIPPSA